MDPWRGDMIERVGSKRPLELIDNGNTDVVKKPALSRPFQETNGDVSNSSLSNWSL